jgi:hypothetical protein
LRITADGHLSPPSPPAADERASAGKQPELARISQRRAGWERTNRHIEADYRPPTRELDWIGDLSTSLPLADELMAVPESRADGCLGEASGLPGRSKGLKNLFHLSVGVPGRLIDLIGPHRHDVRLQVRPYRPITRRFATTGGTRTIGAISPERAVEFVRQTATRVGETTIGRPPSDCSRPLDRHSATRSGGRGGGALAEEALQVVGEHLPPPGPVVIGIVAPVVESGGHLL